MKEKRMNSYRKAKTFRNSEKYTSYRSRVKILLRAAMRTEEIRVAVFCKENRKEFFSYINGRKPIFRKIGRLKDFDRNLHFSS